MAIELNLDDYDSTESLLMAILTHVFEDHRVRILVPPEDAHKVIARIRVKLSRQRKKMEIKGRNYRRFFLMIDRVPWTLANGTRRTCLILSIKKTNVHKAIEALERIDHESL